jgi:tetratricopeptide (TPR) repeat protein
LLRVIEGDPSPDAKAQALLTLGDIYRAQWRFDQARSCYDEIIAKHGTTSARPPAQAHLGGLLNGAGQYDQAAEVLSKVPSDKALRDTALSREIGLDLARAYDGKGEFARAIRFSQTGSTGTSPSQRANPGTAGKPLRP